MYKNEKRTCRACKAIVFAHYNNNFKSTFQSGGSGVGPAVRALALHAVAPGLAYVAGGIVGARGKLMSIEDVWRMERGPVKSQHPFPFSARLMRPLFRQQYRQLRTQDTPGSHPVLTSGLDMFPVVPDSILPR